MLEKESNKDTKQIRFLAIQAAYAYAIHDSIKNTNKIDHSVIHEYDSKNSAKALELVFWLIKNKNTIDDTINQLITDKWKIERINMVVFAILRIIITETIVLKEPITAKFINSYMGIAEMMLEKNDVHFIHAIINRIIAINQDQYKFCLTA